MHTKKAIRAQAKAATTQAQAIEDVNRKLDLLMNHLEVEDPNAVADETEGGAPVEASGAEGEEVAGEEGAPVRRKAGRPRKTAG